MDFAPAELGSFPHSEEAEGAQCVRQVGYLKSYSVILDNEQKVLFFLAQVYAYCVGLGVANDICQTLLEDSESSGGAVAVQMEIDGRNRDLAWDAIARCEVGSLPFNGSSEAKVVENVGAEAAADGAHGLYAIVDGLN